MIIPARDIWAIRIQCVCGIISARDGQEVEVFLSGNFGQASLLPPRIIINPNRLYPIEQIIRREGRFAINVLAANQRDAAIRLMNIRRRATGKTRILGLPVRSDNPHGIPSLENCLRTLFCEVEQVLDTGDHTVIIARVLESRTNPRRRGELPLLYPEVSGTPAKHPGLSKGLRGFLTLTGIKDLVLRMLQKRRGTSAPDLGGNTYWEGGQTDAEIEEILRHGLQDRGRTVFPPEKAPAVLRRKLGVCVVGMGAWGSYHCRLFRKVSPLVELYVCGRDPGRLARVGRAVGAKGCIVGLEKAVQDPRVQALSLVLPHDIHRTAVEMAALAGKHVLVEKPIATALEDADAMIEASRRGGTILMVAEDMHFRPAVREAVAAIARGDIGEPLYLNVYAGGILRPKGWKADKRRMGGGVLIDIGVHYIRALRLLMGEPERVFASRAMQVNTKISGEDSVQLLFSSDYGWQAHMLLNWSSPRGHSPDILVAGEKGSLHLWPGAPYLDHYPAAPRPLTRLLSYVRPPALAEKLMSPTLQRVRKRIPDRDTQGYLTEVAEFLAAVAEQRMPTSKPEDARRDLEIALHGYDALQKGVWVPIARHGTSHV